jgi:hypothetical protein
MRTYPVRRYACETIWEKRLSSGRAVEQNGELREAFRRRIGKTNHELGVQNRWGYHGMVTGRHHVGQWHGLDRRGHVVVGTTDGAVMCLILKVRVRGLHSTCHETTYHQESHHDK